MHLSGDYYNLGTKQNRTFANWIVEILVELFYLMVVLVIG
jgi:hypothetical protein